MSERPAGELRYRHSTVTDVSVPGTARSSSSLIPYDEETLVEIKGRMVTESICAGRVRRDRTAAEPDPGQPRPQARTDRRPGRRVRPGHATKGWSPR